jgi:hypothetical protein
MKLFKLGPFPGVCLTALSLMIAGAGCGLFSPNSASFASVTITGHTEAEIAAATAQVFREDGYDGGFALMRQMTFEREASRGTSLAYEGVVATQGGTRTLVRVRTEIVTLNAEKKRVQCQAYIVKNAGDSFFEDEQRLTNIRSRPYQNLLDKVADKLK